MMNPHSHAGHEGSTPRTVTLGLALLLYLVTVSVDAVRKVGGLPTSLVGVVYLIVGCMYLVLLPGIRNRVGRVPRYLPLWLALLVIWCVAEALAPRVPVSTALLGCASYAFFVPLFYIGAELMTTDRGAARTLRCVTLIGGALGLGAILSAVLGLSAPAVLQPVDPSVGIHTFSAGNIYLAPSVFATGEEAAEELLIALFAWAALTSLPQGRLGRASSAVFATLITVGLFAAERRADIVVAVLGMATLLVLGRPASCEGAGTFILTATPRARSATVFALAPAVIGSAALISFLGTSKLVPFLTSASNGVNAIALIFSPIHAYVLTGQGTGTSTQGIGVLGVQTFTTFVDNHPYESYAYGGRSFLSAEGGLTKTWLELGVVGVALYAGVFLSVLGPPLRSLRRLDGVGRALTVLTVALGIVFLKGHASLDDPLVQPLFWLAAGGIWGRSRVRGTSVGQPPRGTAAGDTAEPSGYLPVPPIQGR